MCTFDVFNRKCLATGLRDTRGQVLRWGFLNHCHFSNTLKYQWWIYFGFYLAVLTKILKFKRRLLKNPIHFHITCMYDRRMFGSSATANNSWQFNVNLTSCIIMQLCKVFGECNMVCCVQLQQKMSFTVRFAHASILRLF